MGKVKKEYLFTLIVVSLIGVAFAAVQIIQASPGTATTGSKPTPVGHTWNEIANFYCPAGECLQSNSSGVLACAVCSGGGTNYWALNGADNLYTLNYSTVKVAIGKMSASYKLDVSGDIRATGFIRPDDYLDLSGTNGIKDYNSSFGLAYQILTKNAGAGVSWQNPSLNCTTVTVSATNNYAYASCASAGTGYIMTGGGCSGGYQCGMTWSYPSGNGWYCAVGNSICNGYGNSTAYARCCKL